VEIEDPKRQTVAQFLGTTPTGLVDAERKAATLRQDLRRAEERSRRRILASPIDGVVQQLAIHTIGGVVTPAQEIMVVVPRDSVLQIEASVQNADIGFVREGQEAEIKVETFPFTKYGLVEGAVTQISRDAVASPPKQPASQNQQQAVPDPLPPQGSVYSARVRMDRDAMMIDGRKVMLTPGMAVTVEVKTGSRRVIEYLLAPLLRYKQESLRER